MKLDHKFLREFLLDEGEPFDKLCWLAEVFLPELVNHLNNNDVRRRLGIYAGEKIPENERNLTDVRNRISLIFEYELARLATHILEEHGIQDFFWTYVVANRFPDLEVRQSSGVRGLRIEVKCLQSISEEKSANFDTLKKDFHPKSDFIVVLLWEWKHDSEGIYWDRAPFVHQAFAFHASSLAFLRDWYWLNQPPNDIGDGFQGFDLRYAVNCKNGKYKQEEGNYGKLLRIWQENFKYPPMNSNLIDRTIKDYLTFKSQAIKTGFDSLAHLILPKLSRNLAVVSILYQNKNVGWQSGDICFLLKSLIPIQKEQVAIIQEVKAYKVYILTGKYAWTEYEFDGSKLNKIRNGDKPKNIRIQGLIEN